MTGNEMSTPGEEFTSELLFRNRTIISIVIVKSRVVYVIGANLINLAITNLEILSRLIPTGNLDARTNPLSTKKKSTKRYKFSVHVTQPLPK
jgi:hypothetical protein